MALDAKSKADVERCAAHAPPLTEAQKNIIAAAFCGAINRPTGGAK